MLFSLVDVSLIVLLLIFVAAGFSWGLIQAIGSLLGLFLGIWLAGQYFVAGSAWVAPFIGGNLAIARVVAFVLILLLTDRLISLLFFLLDKFFHFLAFIPFMKSVNRLGGVLLGAAEGIFALGIGIYAISKIGPEWPIVKVYLDGSQVAHWLVQASSWLTAFLPSAFNGIKSIF